MHTARIQSIDLIKVIAMLMVIMMHLALARRDEGFHPVELQISPFTGIAMPLFFMVSGYLMYKKTRHGITAIERFGV